MRAPGSWSLLLAASVTSNLALAETVAPGVAPAGVPAAPVAATAPGPEPEPEPEPAAPPPAAGDAPAAAATAPPAAVEPAHAASPAPSTARETNTNEATPSDPNATPPLVAEAGSDLTRDYDALPLTLEARLGFNWRIGSSFDSGAEEERMGASYAFATYFAWTRPFALGLELDHTGLGSVRALSGQNSTDNQYTATGAWLGARVFPVRGERLDFFVNLRLGMVWQHVNAFGTRQDSASITEPARSFTCGEWAGPGIGLGGALGLAYRLGRHLSFVSRVDLSGQRLSGDTLGTCADGIGSVASLSGSVGLAYEFETAPK